MFDAGSIRSRHLLFAWCSVIWVAFPDLYVRKESRGAHFRDDYPAKSDEFAHFNIVLRKSPDGQIQLTREPLGRIETDHSGDEVMVTATFRVMRAGKDAGAFRDYTTEVTEDMVARPRAPDPGRESQRPGRSMERIEIGRRCANNPIEVPGLSSQIPLSPETRRTWR